MACTNSQLTLRIALLILIAFHVFCPIKKREVSFLEPLFFRDDQNAEIDTTSATQRISVPRNNVTRHDGECDATFPKVHAANGWIFCVPEEALHCPVAQTLRNGKVWERATVEYLINHTRKILLRRNVGKENVWAITAGTFFGNMLPAFGSVLAGNKNALLYAIEPNYRNYDASLQTLRANKLDASIRLIHAALTNHKHEKKVNAQVCVRQGGVANGGSSWVDANTVGFEVSKVSLREKRESVNVTSIDDILPRTGVVAFIHLDVEGHEEHAILGAERTLRSRDGPEVLVIESVNANTEALLNSYGYTRSALALDANALFTKKMRF
eukprot:gene657-1099_t